jgi:hypothetical protein
VFVEWWKKQETDLSIRWNVQGVGVLKVNRVQYSWEKEEMDLITGEVKKISPAHKRLARQLLFLPFAALAALVLSIVLVVTFLIEAIISDVYGEELANYWVQHANHYRHPCTNDRSGCTLSSNSPSRCVSAIHHRIPDIHRYTTVGAREPSHERRIRAGSSPESFRLELRHIFSPTCSDGLHICAFWLEASAVFRHRLLAIAYRGQGLPH